MEFAEKELIAEFVIESQEGLAKVENQMLAIEAAGANVDPELVNAVFRTMHTIKGTAGFLGLDRIATLAHALEEVLNSLRNREITPTSELVSSVLQAVDVMTELINAVESSNDVDVTPYVARLQNLRQEATAAGKPPAIAGPDVEATTCGSSTAVTTSAALSESTREFLIDCQGKLDQMERDLAALEANPDSEPLFREVFRTVHALKTGAQLLGLDKLEQLGQAAEGLLHQVRKGQRSFDTEVICALKEALAQSRAGLRWVETQGGDCSFQPQLATDALQRLMQSQPEPLCEGNDSQSVRTRPAAAERCASEGGDAPVKTPVESPPLDKAHAGAVDTTLRVDVALLDKLMTLVGELVLARNQILQHTNNLDDSDLVRTAQRLNLITTELQEGVMKMRMQPIGNVWNKFPRVVRDLASQLGKQVRIEMEGKDTELDKTIVEAIKDPLTHLIRNAVDHGIEPPAERLAAGKPATGLLLLRAFHEGGQVNIEITDDGAGLNLERIRRKAVEKGLISADQAARMGEREVSQLIMLPGFSTADRVTSVSGRGVGMDVVKTNMERLGGTIDIQTRSGQGTTFKIKIPLTLAIIPALIVTNDGDRYAIPQVSILELVRLEGEQAQRGIEFVHGAPVYRLRGKLLPLLYLSKQLRIDQTQSNTEVNGYDKSDSVVNIVVLRANDQQFGLVVDKVNDTEEIVVKPLSRQLKNLGQYAGATILGDGTVALILDVMGLAVAAGLAGDMQEQAISASVEGEIKRSEESQSLLIVDMGDSRQCALPTSMVCRLEKVPRSAIEWADGREVIQYRQTILPLIRLEHVCGSAGGDNQSSDELQLVVYAETDKSYGLVVNRIVDIVQTTLRFDGIVPEHDHLLGTTVVQQRVTDVLNLHKLAKRVPSARPLISN